MNENIEKQCENREIKATPHQKCSKNKRGVILNKNWSGWKSLFRTLKVSF